MRGIPTTEYRLPISIKMDFTLSTYNTLIETLQQQGFSFFTFEEFVSNPAGKIVVLRHDVDSLPLNSLNFARIQAGKGIKATYYFRIVPKSFDEKIIKEIYELGHEVGYHYEDFSMAAERQKTKVKRQKWGSNDNYEKYLAEFAIESFKVNLAKLRSIVPVRTICMHGSPMSRWNSRLLWKYYDYHDFGIVGEPYFDINFDDVLYLTDTGRRWDGDSYNIRDKATGDRRQGAERKEFALWANLARSQTAGVAGGETKGRGGEVGSKKYEVSSKKYEAGSKLNNFSDKAHHIVDYPAPGTQHPISFPRFHSTFDIIKAAEEGRLPDKIMMTFHPQRWTDKPVPWMQELVWQNVKNVGKFFLVKWRN